MNTFPLAIPFVTTQFFTEMPHGGLRRLARRLSKCWRQTDMCFFLIFLEIFSKHFNKHRKPRSLKETSDISPGHALATSRKRSPSKWFCSELECGKRMRQTDSISAACGSRAWCSISKISPRLEQSHNACQEPGTNMYKLIWIGISGYLEVCRSWATQFNGREFVHMHFFFTDLEPEIECHGTLRSWPMNCSGDVRICWHTRYRRMAGEQVDV